MAKVLPNIRNPAPGVMKFRVWCHHYYIHVLSLTDPCLSVDKKRKRNTAFSL